MPGIVAKLANKLIASLEPQAKYGIMNEVNPAAKVYIYALKKGQGPTLRVAMLRSSLNARS